MPPNPVQLKLTSVPPGRPPAARVGLWLLVTGMLATLTTLAALAAAASPLPVQETVGLALQRTTGAGWAPAIYLIAAFGIGRLFRPLFRGTRSAIAIQCAVGVGMMLWISHVLLQTAGPTATGRLWSIPIMVVGVGLALDQLRGHLRAQSAPQATPSASTFNAADIRGRLALVIVASVPIAVLMMAAAVAPGWLWDSEFSGYDVLSYHLQLPQEWLLRGRLEPLQHNVYSFLPGFVEAGFTHLALLMGLPPVAGIGGIGGATSGTRMGLLAGDGLGVLACQYLHAAITILSAWLCASCASAAARRVGMDDAPARRAAMAAGILVLGTPWMLVTGSLAYNDMAVVLLAAGALTAALEPQLTPVARGALCGLLLGAACGAKPTALFLAGPAIAAAMLVSAPPRQWWSMLTAACGVGLVMLAPWLLRNWLAAANPVFPAFASVFGTGHWTPEQVDRFARNHTFHGPLLRRLSLLVLPDATDPAGLRHRGLLHVQWGLFFPVVLLAAADAAFWLRRQPVVWALVAGLALQLAAWLFVTHIQSRFLLPLVPVGACLFALAGAAAMRRFRTSAMNHLAAAAVFTTAVLQVSWSVRFFLGQRSGEPLATIALTPSFFAGALPDGISPEDVALLTDEAPAIYLHRNGVTGITMLGAATPFYLPTGTIYATTWDRLPIDFENHSQQHAAAGTGLLLVDLNEIARLSRSGIASPGLNVEAVTKWLERETLLVKGWPKHQMYLVKLASPESPAQTVKPGAGGGS